jgi:hypothetical protein
MKEGSQGISKILVTNKELKLFWGVDKELALKNNEADHVCKYIWS